MAELDSLLDNVRAIDFETTNIDPNIAHPLEVALFGLNGVYRSLIRPPVAIPVETSAVHHIVDDDVQNAPVWEVVQEDLKRLICKRPNPVLVAHNAKYEQAIVKDMFAPFVVRWICTYKCALRLWPDAPNFKNETLRYWLGLPNLGRAHDQNAHTAGHDAEVTFAIFLELLKRASIDEMVKWTLEPAAFTKIPFGKHAGSKWEDLPYDYLVWITNQGTMEQDIKHCAKAEIARRKSSATTPRKNA